MAELDNETVEEACRAFDGDDAGMDAWESAVDAPSEGKEEHADDGGTAGDTGDTPDGETPDGDKGCLRGDMSKVEMINSRLTREQAKSLTLPEYDSFGDVVDGHGVRPERLAEYTSVIPFWYKSFKDGTGKMGMLPKYPRFLDLFGVSEASRISMTDVLEKFAPGLHRELMDRDRDADLLARSAGEIISRRGLDLSRKLDDDDYAILERNGVKDPRKYRTMSEVTGLNEGIYDADPDAGVVYNSDYAAAMAGMSGKDNADDCFETVSLEDVIGGLDPKYLKGFLGKGASEIKEVDSVEYSDEGGAPFMPFGERKEVGSIFRSMQEAAGKTGNAGKPW